MQPNIRLNKEYLQDIIGLTHQLRTREIQRLSQSDRKLIVLSCEAFKEQKNLQHLQSNHDELEKLKDKLKYLKNDENTVRCHESDSFLDSFFKLIFTKLHLRISTSQVKNKVHELYETNFDENTKQKIQLKEALKKVSDNFFLIRYHLGILAGEKISILQKDKTNKIIQTIDSFQKLADSIEEFKQRYNQNPEEAIHFLREKSGLKLENFNPKDLDALYNGPSLLVAAYNKSKENGRFLEFLNVAFVSDDYMEIHKQLEKFAEVTSSPA